MKTVDGFFFMLILMEKGKMAGKAYTAKDKIFSKLTKEGLKEEQTKFARKPVGCQDFCTAIYCKLVASEKESNGNCKMKCYNTSNG